MALYVEGWKHLQVPDYESLKKSIGLFDRAIALDDAFYDAHLARGEAYRWIYGYYETPRDVLPKVVAAFEKARDLRPDSAEPLAALGLTYAMAWDWTPAWENLNAARARDPQLAITDLGLALYYRGLGEVERMKQALYRARDNDPLNVEIGGLGKLDAVPERRSRCLARVGQRHDGEASGRSRSITTDAAIGAYLAGDNARAVKLAEQGRVLEDSPLAQIILAQAYGYNGQKSEVRPLLESAARSGVHLPLRVGGGLPHPRRGRYRHGTAAAGLREALELPGVPARGPASAAAARQSAPSRALPRACWRAWAWMTRR